MAAADLDAYRALQFVRDNLERQIEDIWADMTDAERKASQPPARPPWAERVDGARRELALLLYRRWPLTDDECRRVLDILAED